MSSIKQLPLRSKVRTADTWDLASLFPDDDAWEKAFTAWEKRIGGYADFQGRLGNDAETLAAAALALDSTAEVVELLEQRRSARPRP